MNDNVYTSEKIGFVFINGAGLESSIWSQVVENFPHPYLLIDFPFRKDNEPLRKQLSLADYVDHMEKQIVNWPIQKFIIVAHSLGGTLAIKLASKMPERIAGFIAVGAIIPKNGGSFLSALPFHKRLLLTMILPKVGTKPPKSAILAGLCNDLSPEVSTKIVEGFVPESIQVYTDRTDAVLIDVPKLYIRLTNDKEIGLSMQNKMIAHFSSHSIQNLNSGHLPMLSNPQKLQHVLLQFIDPIKATT